MSEAKKPAKKPGDEEGSPIWGTVAKVGGILLIGGFFLWLVLSNVAATTSILLLAIGIGGAVSILIFLWGFAIYISRLGNDNRADGIDIMTSAVTLLFCVVVLGGILRFLETYVS